MKSINIKPKDLVAFKLNFPYIKELENVDATEKTIYELLMGGHKVEENLVIDGKETKVPLNISNYKNDNTIIPPTPKVDNSSEKLAELKKELADKNNQLSGLNNKVNQLNNVVSQRDKKISELGNAIKEKDKKIAELEKELEAATEPKA